MISRGKRPPAGHIRSRRVAWLPVLLLALVTGCRGHGPPPPAWEAILPGLELGQFAVPDSAAGNIMVHLVRVDPRRFTLRLRAATEDTSPQPLTVREWCRREGAVAAINAGMYREDGLTSVGLLRTGHHANNPRLGRQRMVLLVDPRDPADPPVRLVDRTCDDYRSLAARYRGHLQSIRMVGCGRRIVWRAGGRRHPVAAIAIDGRGRVLLLHCGEVVDPHVLLEHLLALPIGVERVMYLEGGRPGQLYVAAGGRRLEYTGRAAGLNLPAAPVPNVLLVVPREVARGE